MKNKAKSRISLLLTMVMLVGLTGCKKNLPTPELTTEQMKQDVQEYTNAFVDPSATITSFFSSQENVSDNEIIVTCQVAWDGSIGNGTGIFNLSYKLNDNIWELINCNVSNDDSKQSLSNDEQNYFLEKNNDISDDVSSDDSNVENVGLVEESVTPQPAIEIKTTLTGYSTSEIGTFENNFDGNLTVHREKLMLINNDNTCSFLSTKGQLNNTKKYVYVYQLLVDETNLSNNGYWVVAGNDATDENCMGIIDADGNEILPCEALWIDMILGAKDRFVDVYYSTGEINSEDGCIKKIEYSDTKETHYYKGYRKVFDLYTKSFVSNIESTSKYLDAFESNLTNIVVDDGKNNTVYNAEGKQVFQTTNNVFLGENFFTVSIPHCNYIYNSSGNEIYSSELSFDVISRQSQFLRQKKSSDDSNYIIIDQSGSPVMSTPLSIVCSESQGIVDGMNADGSKYQLININGDILCESDENFVESEVHGYFYTEESDSKTILVGPNGIISKDAGSGVYDLICRTDDYHYLILNTGEYSLSLNSSARELTNAMVTAADVSGKYEVYDLFTGNTLLPQKYDEILYASGYIYALDGSTWHVFQVNQLRN